MAYAIGAFASNTSASGTVATASFTPTAGAALVAFVRFSQTGGTRGTVTFSDTEGANDTWTQVNTGLWNSGDWILAECYVLLNASATATTVQAVNSQTSNGGVIAVVEVQGITTSSAVVGSAMQIQSNPGNGANAITSGNTAALSSQPAAVIGFSLPWIGTNVIAVGTGYTSVGTFATAGRAEHKRVTATDAVAATFTESTTGDTYNFYTVCVALAEGSSQSNAPRAAHLMKLMGAM